MPTEIEPTQFPLLEEFFVRGFGTLYVLRDSAFRLRDATSALSLTRFFAERGVRLDVIPLRAQPGQRYLSKDDVMRAVGGEAGVQDRLTSLLRERGLEAFVEELYEEAAKKEGERELQRAGRQASVVPPLAPRGPILMLGRPTLFPPELVRQIGDELASSRGSGFSAEPHRGRFRMPEEPEQSRFRTVSDTYYNVTTTLDTSRHEVDLGIVRKVRGAFDTRTFLFAYGTSSLGTQAAAQVLTDRDQNEELRRRGTPAHFARYREVEVLIEVRRRTQGNVDSALVLAGMTSDPRRRELPPNELYIKVGPDEPLAQSARDAIEWFTATPPSDPLELSITYRRLADGGGQHGVLAGSVCFEVDAGHPSSAKATRMAGGREIQRVVEEIQALVRHQPTEPILFIGPPGTGKELGARIVCEEVVNWRLGELANDQRCQPPVFVGTRFETFNCAALVDTLAESLLFGIVKGAAADVVTNAGVILTAGEGVVFLDELSFLTPAQQGKLLRVFEDRHVRPVGYHDVRISATIVCAMSDDPDDLEHEGKLLPALYGRFRGRVVRMPPVGARVADIPAVLTALARRPVRMSERVLRSLMAMKYGSNVRDLQRIVARAERRQGVGVRPEVIDLAIDDLGSQDQLPGSLDWSSGRDEKTYAFTPARVAQSGSPVIPTLDFREFTEAARVLTSLAFADGKLAVRHPLGEEWRADHFQSVSAAAYHWLRVLATGQDLDAPALESWFKGTLGAMAKMRWPKEAAAMAFRRAIVDTADRKDMGQSIADKRLAWSLGIDASNLRPRHRQGQGPDA